MPSLKPEQRFPALVQPPVGKPSTKNPNNNKPPNNQLPKQKWWEEDFDKRSYDDVISTPKYDPLEGVDPDFIWDGTKKEKSPDDKYDFTRGVNPDFIWDGTKQKKSPDDKYDFTRGVNPDFIWDGTKKEKSPNDKYDFPGVSYKKWDGTKQKKNTDDDKYIFPRTVDPGVRFVGTKPNNRKVGRKPRLPIKIQPEGYKPPVWKKPKNVDDGKYDPNWDQPRFQEEVTLTTVDEDGFYTMDEEFSPPRFPAGKARGRPIKNNLEPEWDDEEFYGQGKKKEGTSFGRQPQEIEWW